LQPLPQLKETNNVNVKHTETHEQIIRAHIDRRELEKLLVNAVSQKAVGASLFEQHGVKYDVSFADVTEGSPGYKVGTQATVTVTVDMLPQDTKA
jgi:hypothetical protein